MDPTTYSIAPYELMHIITLNYICSIDNKINFQKVGTFQLQTTGLVGDTMAEPSLRENINIHDISRAVSTCCSHVLNKR